MSKQERKKKSDIYGLCRHCGNIGWHKKIGFADIHDVGIVSVFKCRRCKHKFGFLVEGENEHVSEEEDEYDIFGDDLDDMLRRLWDPDRR